MIIEQAIVQSLVSLGPSELSVIARCRDYRGSDCMMFGILGPSELSVIGRCRIIEEAIEQSLVSLGPSELSVIGRCRIIEEAIVWSLLSLGASELSAIGRCRDYRGSDWMKFSIFRSKWTVRNRELCYRESDGIKQQRIKCPLLYKVFQLLDQINCPW